MSVFTAGVRDDARTPRSVPWTGEDLIRWLSAATLSGVLVAVGWYLAAGQASDVRQFGPLDLAIGAALLGGIANLTWLLRGWHALGARRKTLISQLPTDVRAREVPRDTQSTDIGLLVGEGSRYFHGPSCPLSLGRQWQPAPLAEHLRAGREPCGMCKP